MSVSGCPLCWLVPECSDEHLLLSSGLESAMFCSWRCLLKLCLDKEAGPDWTLNGDPEIQILQIRVDSLVGVLWIAQALDPSKGQ